MTRHSQQGQFAGATEPQPCAAGLEVDAGQDVWLVVPKGMEMRGLRWSGEMLVSVATQDADMIAADEHTDDATWRSDAQRVIGVCQRKEGDTHWQTACDATRASGGARPVCGVRPCVRNVQTGERNLLLLAKLCHPKRLRDGSV